MASLRLVRVFLWLTVFLVCGSRNSARAQFQQDYIKTTQNGRDIYFYQPTNAAAPEQVIDLGPGKAVYLVYNCFYMRDICKNADNFAHTERGKNLHPRSEIADGIYGYDLSSYVRTNKRRQHSCPGSWKNTHPCPEFDQRLPMRHDGEWFTTDLEPDTKSNFIKNHYASDGKTILDQSKMRYSCDEFPPASWVEGGDGEDADQPAQTRCAALRCQAGAKAEQDWQATSHRKLRDVLVNLADTNVPPFPSFHPSKSVVFFNFYRTKVEDGVAARVMVFNITSVADVLDQNIGITQGFRRRDVSTEPSGALRSLPYEELRKLVEAHGGLMSEHIVHANDSALATTTVSTGFQWGVGGANDGGGVALNFEASCEDAGKDRTWSNGTARRTPLLPRHIPENVVAPLAKRASTTDLARAQKVVADAVAESARRNGARMARPLRNVYGMRPGSVAANNKRTAESAAEAAADNSAVMPLLRITDQIADAAALVAEAEAHGVSNVTRKRSVAVTGTYWMQGLARKGTVPWGNDPSYVVFRNVLDYGAVGDGVTDDTKAIKKAMSSGGRCGEKCNGSTTKNAIVYFPPGRYLISSTIPMPFGTQVIGDANTRPTLVASGRFVGLGVLSTDEYTGGDGGNEEYYVNTANFYRQIRNIVIDITGASANISCLHYQVAQATSLQNVELVASTDPAKNQIGMFAENGSGGHISDVTFKGGSIGFYGGSQQFTAQRLTFSGCRIGVHVIWDWGWVWKSITMSGVDVGFRLVSIDGAGSVGSVSVMDSSFTNVHTAAVVISPPPAGSSAGSAGTGLVLENVALSGVAAAVRDTTGRVHLDGSAAVVSSWILGTTYKGSVAARSTANGGPVGDHRRHAGLLDSTGAYYERPKPQYEDKAVGDFLHVKDFGARGDGSTDDTAAFQRAVYASLGKILFVDAGSYILTSTIVIPSGAKLVGETWSQLVASGSFFEDARNPKVLIQVGTVGSVGSVEMQDLLFSTRGPTAGLVLIEWNIQAASAGSAGLWDCHARIGGATGTKLTPAECPPSTSGTDAGCSAASLMMHLTAGASGYFENMWLWGADHIIDDQDLSDSKNDMTQCSIYIARGFLIESTHPTWLYGTASEHSVFYQYNFHQAARIFAGFLQTESPYFQPTPPPPAPFAAVVGGFPGDPDYTCTTGNEFSGCDESWAVIMTGSEDIFIASAGVYSWFSTYSQACIDTQACQKTLVQLHNNKANVRIQNLVTIGSKYMAVMDGDGIAADVNLNVHAHPFWSLVTNLDVGHNGMADYRELVWIDPTIWDMAQPSFTCVAPCYVKLPPYTGATSTVNYPLLTASSGTWTTTITQPPMTISEWVLEVVTIAPGGASGRKGRNAKREVQDFRAFRPVPATTPFWPSVVYTGANGLPTTTAPSQKFPTPPAGIVQRDVRPVEGFVDYPFVLECGFFDLDCVPNPYLYGPAGDGPDPGDYEDENSEDLKVVCPLTRTLTPPIVPTTGRPATSSSVSTSTTSAIPLPSPHAVGDPSQNTVSCYNGGERTENDRMQNATLRFCNDIQGDALADNYFRELNYDFPYNGGVGFVNILVSLKIADGCDWAWNLDECKRYLRVPTDSCDCGGVNGKHGGKVTNNCYTWRIDPNRHFLWP